MEVWTMVNSDKVSAATEHKVSRRRLVRDSALTAGALALASQIDTKYALAQDEGPVKIGWLGDRTGDFSVVGVQKFNAANLAVKELNDADGILGREVVLVAEDAQSDNRRYQEMARKLILQDKVDVLHAGFTSASREAIRPIVDQNKMLYFYNNQYEGGVCDSWVFPTGCVPDHQVVPFVPAVMELFGNRFYTIAADYNFGQLTADWFKVTVEAQGGRSSARSLSRSTSPSSAPRSPTSRTRRRTCWSSSSSGSSSPPSTSRRTQPACSCRWRRRSTWDRGMSTCASRRRRSTTCM
jgi:ABC-type branched-subunit amino acid transport system substrate-binding protein